MRRGFSRETDFDRHFRRTGLFMKGVGFLVLLGFCAVVALLVYTKMAGNEEAENSARDFSRHIPGANGMQCASMDTDNDGYISCTVFRQGQDPLFLECGSGVLGNTGCRAQKTTIRHTGF